MNGLTGDPTHGLTGDQLAGPMQMVGSDVRSSGAEVKRRGSIDMSLDELQKVLNSLGEDVSRLEERFGPILRPQEPVNEGQGTDANADSVPPMVRAIVSLILQAQQINRNVRALHERCEL